MTDAQAALAQVREALAAGPTPGEWRYIVDDGDRKITAEVGGSFMCDTAYYPWCPDNEGDWKLIAACSPANIAAILAHVEAQAAEIERLQVGIELIETENADLLTRLDLESGTVGMIARECADLRRQLDECSQMLARQAAAIRERDELRRQLAEAERDARRYRWLRIQPNDTAAPRIDVVYWTPADESANDGEGLRLTELDAAIDAAMGASNE